MTSSRSHRSRRRVLALVGTGTLLAGLGVSGAALAAPTGASAVSPTASQGWAPPGYGYGGPGSGGGPGYGGYGGYGGFGGWSGSGTVQSLSGLDVLRASGSQLTGMVRIVSTTSSGTAIGTGMVLASDGEVVTNHHVVEGATRIRVRVLASGTTYTARVVGTDAGDDIAVLQLRGASGLTTVSIDRSGVAVGDAVTAVGDALGTRRLHAAPGTVRKLRTAITTSSEGEAAAQRLRGLLEIDADVVSGDSGGATLDSDGEVVGMTTAASSGSATITGYAIPIAKVVRIAGRIEAGVDDARIVLGYHAFLGVELSPSTDSPVLAGVVAGTGADDAGLAAGDTVTSVDGTRVGTASALQRAIRAHGVGETVRVTWTDAGGTSHSADVSLGRAPVA